MGMATQFRRWQASPSVRHALVNGCRVVLDLRTGSYQVLNPAATAMWEILTGDADPADALIEMSSRYRVPLARLEQDLSAFSDLCRTSRLLEPENHADAVVKPPLRAGASAPTILLALRSMMATSRALARDGFAVTYLQYAQFPQGTSPTARRALTIFARAENFFLSKRGSEDCLARSLALYRFLSRVNVQANHVIGVCRFPFRAHAWVETEGTAAFQGSVADYTPLARL